ncbi:MAG: DUF115 domain-containing protein [Lachnospiraceae bacterium]|nr:DUF115 domain-containing protein [Lachnospiraceae bacterium]
MEDFIKKIYDISFIIYELKEFIFLSDSGHPDKARSLYNSIAGKLEIFLNTLSQTDLSKAQLIQSIALDIKEHYEDRSYTVGLIEGTLLPSLYSYTEKMPSIDVTENNYTLVSSKTGFLTIKDNNMSQYFHNTCDPMYEAYRMAESVYDPLMDNFMILGCGLGYLAYQIYHISDGSTKIYIYEDDPVIIDYAFHYGVLSLIPEDILTIIGNPDIDFIAKDFINTLNTLNNTGFTVSSWKRTIYDSVCNRQLERIVLNKDFDTDIHKQSILNLRMNNRLPYINFEDLRSKFNYSEWITVSAGPSLDDFISFIKDNKGKAGIIAVNTVLRRLLNEGIIPDIVVAADQRNNMVKHIEGIEDLTENIYLVADRLLNWKYTDLYKGPIAFIKIAADSVFPNDFLKDKPGWDISGSVACLAVETALKLNAKTIYLAGQDLAYPGGRKYAADMPHSESPDAKWEIKVPSVDGSVIYTCEVFNWFRKSLEHQISCHPKVKFINLSRHGARIKGTEPVHID